MRRTALDRLNPVTRALVAVVLSLPLILTLDWVSAAVALGCVVVLALACGFTPAQLGRRLAPLALLGLLAAVSMALYGQPSGRVWFGWFLVRVTDGSLALAVAVFVRMLALGLSAVLLFGGIDPTDLGDGLAQVLRLPARFVLGAVAGVRMMGLLVDDWRMLGLARRARGLGDTGRLRRWLTMAFALLVLALRRGSRLATAMEARGFGATGPDAPVRTWARPSRLGGADVVALLVAALVAGVAIGAAAWAGTLHGVWS